MPQSMTLLFRSILVGRFYSFVSVIGLSVAIAAVILVSALAHHELSYEKQFSGSERIYRLNWINGGTGDRFATMFNPFSPPFAAETADVEIATRVGTFEVLLERAKGPASERLSNFELFAFADPTFFRVFDFDFITGDRDSALASPGSLVLTRAAAEKYFPGEPALGKSLTLERNLTLIVTAVIDDMPASTHFPFHFIVPLETARDVYDGAGWLDFWGSDRVYHYLLLRSGADPESIEERLMDFAGRHMPFDNWDFEIEMQALEEIHFTPDLQNEMPFRDTIRNIVKSPRKKSDLGLFFAGALVLVLIASFNFMNLQVARGVGRSKELGLLKVVGASRYQVFERLLAESLLFAFISLGLAFVITGLTVELFAGTLAVSLGWQDVLEPQVMLLVVLLTAALGLVSGAYPAWIMASQQPVKVLKGEFSHGHGVHQVRQALVMLQFTVSIILIAISLAIYAQIRYSISAPLGFEHDRTAIIPINRSEAGNDFETLRLRLIEHPDISLVTRGSIMPTGNLSDGASMYRDGASPDDFVAMRRVGVDFDYFETFGMQFAGGRSFHRDFAADEFSFPSPENPVSRGGIVINEAAARRAGWTEPAGAAGGIMRNSFEMDGIEVALLMEIVGVVKDVHFRSLRAEVVPMVFFLGREGGNMAVKVTSEDTSAAVAHMERVWRETVPELPFAMTWLTDSVSELYDQEARTLELLGGVAIIAIVVACLGLFAVASLVTELRRKEVALRKVFGASVMQLVNLLSRRFLKAVILANVIAIPIAWYYLDGWLTNFVYRIDLTWMHFIVPATATLVAAWATVAAQALTVARRSPIHALRHE